MIKLSKLEEAQELVVVRKELLERLKAMQNRDRGWLEGFSARVGFDTLFGEGESGGHVMDFTPEFYATAAQIAQLIENYLRIELANIESSLGAMGVQIKE